jgi:hypothetical protein
MSATTIMSNATSDIKSLDGTFVTAATQFKQTASDIGMYASKVEDLTKTGGAITQLQSAVSIMPNQITSQVTSIIDVNGTIVKTKADITILTESIKSYVKKVNDVLKWTADATFELGPGFAKLTAMQQKTDNVATYQETVQKVLTSLWSVNIKTVDANGNMLASGFGLIHNAEWQADFLYEVGQVVFYNDKNWYCVEKHTALAPSPPNSQHVAWQELPQMNGMKPTSTFAINAENFILGYEPEGEPLIVSSPVFEMDHVIVDGEKKPRIRFNTDVYFNWTQLVDAQGNPINHADLAKKIITDNLGTKADEYWEYLTGSNGFGTFISGNYIMSSAIMLKGANQPISGYENMTFEGMLSKLIFDASEALLDGLDTVAGAIGKNADGTPMTYDDLIYAATQGTTLIAGGFIRTELIQASALFVPMFGLDGQPTDLQEQFKNGLTKLGTAMNNLEQLKIAGTNSVELHYDLGGGKSGTLITGSGIATDVLVATFAQFQDVIIENAHIKNLSGGTGKIADNAATSSNGGSGSAGFASTTLDMQHALHATLKENIPDESIYEE